MNKFSKEKLEACMLYANFDVRELAESSNVAPTTIYEILSGKKKNPQAETLSKLSGALSVNINALFHDTSIIIKEPRPKVNYQLPINKNREILSKITKLSTEDKKLFEAMLERLTKVE